MGRLFLIELEGDFFKCIHCDAHLGSEDEIISKSLRCRDGRAYLFNKVVNVTFGEKEERQLITGYHTVVDIFCVKCGCNVGWKYEAAERQSERYKVGKFILKRRLLMWSRLTIWYENVDPQN